jgi:hypothetical protein
MTGMTQDSKPTPLLVIASKQGQLGNRLALFARFIAFSVETGIPVVNLGFGEYSKYFENTSTNGFCRFWEGDGFYSLPSVQNLFGLYRVYLKALRSRAGMDSQLSEIDTLSPEMLDAPTDELTRDTLLEFAYLMIAQTHSKRLPADITEVLSIEETVYNMETEPFIRKLLSSAKIWLMDGWGFQAVRSLERHSDKVRKFLVPIEKHRNKTSEILSCARAKGELLIGVHIRGTDYKTYLKGKYYYPREYYRAVMEGIHKKFGSRTAFLVCSDEPQDFSAYPNLNITISDGNLVEDMYALAGCDVIAGPPSTFSSWAAFYGKVRKLELDGTHDFLAEL